MHARRHTPVQPLRTEATVARAVLVAATVGIAWSIGRHFLALPVPVQLLLDTGALVLLWGLLCLLHLIQRRTTSALERQLAELQRALDEVRTTAALLAHCTDAELARLRELRRRVEQQDPSLR